jgi:hypothetical protein
VILVTADEPERPVLVGFRAAPARQSVYDEHALTFAGKGPVYYLLTGIALLAVAVTLFALVAIVRSHVRRKWLWALGAMVGIGKVTLTWTTGAWAIKPLSVTLFSAGIVQEGATEPWVLSAAFPFFAVLFLIRHGWRRRPAETALARDQPAGIGPGGGSLAVW